MKLLLQLLGYAVKELEGEEFTQARENNIVNSLNGKVSGVQITNSSGAVGSSSRITLRGPSSITGTNEPPDINPDDIESLTVLKGPNAAALYGVRAANGVIIITTKKGKANKKGNLGISFNSSTTFETPLVIPSFQNSYGQGPDPDFFEWLDGSNSDGGVDESWGPPLDVGLEFVQWQSYINSDDYDGLGAPLPWVSNPDNIKDFYDMGITTNNNIAFTGGDERVGFRLSAGYMDQKGIVPNTDFNKISLGGSSNMKIADKLNASLSVNYTKSNSGNLPTQGYDNENPVQQMIWSGRQVDFAALKDYENFPLSPDGTAAAGTPLNWNTVFQNNPYWVLENNVNKYDKDRVLGSVNLNYPITNNLSANLRVGSDFYNSVTKEQKAIGSNEFGFGYYREIYRRFNETNTELRLSYNTALGSDLNLNLNVAGNAMSRNYSNLRGEAPQLELPNLYALSNVKSGVSTILTNETERSKINSIYAFGQFGFKNALYLDFSIRNDWASVLPKENNSFLYPSVSVSAVISELFDLNQNTWSLLKVRGGWAKVGGIGSLEPYQLTQNFLFRNESWGSVLLPFDDETLNNPNLISESTQGFEVGLDGNLFNNRVRFDATYYDQTSLDLIVDVQVSSASGYRFTGDNVGEMRNTGIELGLGSTIVKSGKFKVDLDLNWSKNNNEVVSLGELDALTLGGQWNVDLQARPGHPYGVIFGPGYVKSPNGEIVHANGLPLTDENLRILGDIQPDWTGGATLSVGYGPISLSGIVDAKIGGDIYSMTTTWGRFAGVLNETLIGRESGIVGEGVVDMGDGVYEPNTIVVSGETYNKVAFSNDIAEGSVFDASYVKLRQVMFTYKLPDKLFKTQIFNNASISLVGRNLAILYKNAPHIDPESAFGSANDLQGMEFGQLPSTRSVGLNLNLKF